MRKWLEAVVVLPVVLLPGEVYFILWLILKPSTLWQKAAMVLSYFLFFWNGQRILIEQWIKKYLTERGQ